MISNVILQMRRIFLGMSSFKSPFLVTLKLNDIMIVTFTDGIKVDLAIATAAKYMGYISRA